MAVKKMKKTEGRGTDYVCRRAETKGSTVKTARQTSLLSYLCHAKCGLLGNSLWLRLQGTQSHIIAKL
jgi:hypothetical protein